MRRPTTTSGSFPSLLRSHRLTRSLGACVVLSASLLACGSDDDASSSTASSSTAAAAATAATAGDVATSASADATVASTLSSADSTDASSPDATDASSPDASSPAGGATTGAVDLEAYCAGEVRIETISSALGNPDADVVAVAQSLLEAAEPVRELAPAELTATFDAAISALQQTIDTKDPTPLFSLDTSPLHDYDREHCGWAEVPVTLIDYHFNDLPETLPAGPTDFEVTNEGTEFHVLLIVQRKDGVTQSWDELLQSPDFQTSVEDVAGAAAAPGESGYGVVDLKPGEYLALCPVPVGSTGPEEGTGPPHFTQGMHMVITVT
jgi:hypothetical protein